MSAYRHGRKPKKWADWPDPAHEMREEGELVIRCRRVTGQDCDVFTFWCSYCGKEHIHGAQNGHRLAHCINPDSPYHAGGYILVGPGGLTTV